MTMLRNTLAKASSPALREFSSVSASNTAISCRTTAISNSFAVLCLATRLRTSAAALLAARLARIVDNAQWLADSSGPTLS